MVKNYLKTAFRYLLKNRVFSFINIIGMATGLACVLIIASYVRLELSYDDFHSNSESLYRVTVNWEDDGQRVNSAMNHAPLAPILKESISGIVNTVRMYPVSITGSADKQNKIKESGFVFVDSTFFRVFTFQALEGDLANALDAPFSVVLSESAAIRHFGSTDVVGEVFYYEDDRRQLPFTITGVMADLPENTHFDFDILGSFNTMDQIMSWYNNWHHPPIYIYAQAQKGKQHIALQEEVNQFVYSRLPDYVQDENRVFTLQPVRDIHLHSDLENEWKANSQYRYVRIFIIIALFILIIACLNFVNLATARSLQRAKEVGMRKTLGASRKQLIHQYLGESFLTTLLAFALALGLGELVLRYLFENIIEQELSLRFLWSVSGIAACFLVYCIISFLSGIYPALYLSGYKPIKALSQSHEKKGSKFTLRRTMVVFQFFVSSLLITGTLLVGKQTSFLRNKDLGFDKESIVAITLPDKVSQTNYAVLKTAIEKEANVQHVALSAALMGSNNFHGFQTYPEGIPDGTDYSLKTLGVDEDFLETYGIEVIAGRDFSKDITTDETEAIILNEAAVKKLDWQEPIGKEFGLTIYTGRAERRNGKVVGVVPDFHFASLYNRVEPLVIYINKHPYYSDFLSVRFANSNLENNINMLADKWKAFNPEKPFEYAFIDEELDKFYTNEVRKSKIFTAFSFLSIFISCLGLLGISAYSLQLRTKEVGIRKVMGAGMVSILHLLSREYVVMVLVANVIAIPLVWFFGLSWLNSFEYKTNLSPGLFLVALVIALILAVITVCIQVFKTALMNPVKTLKDE
ncbi:MAG: ABC transporter permease [Bacteroidota bacterium]